MKKSKQNKKNLKKINEIIEKRYNILIIIILLIMSVLAFNLYNVQILNNKYYIKKVKELNQNIVYGNTAPRGRIYDRNGNLIVDNKGIKVIYYKKLTGMKTSDEIKVAYALANIIDVDYSKMTDEELKDFWIKNNSKAASDLIKDSEWKELKKRKITSDDIYNLKLKRIDKQIEDYNELDLEAAYIYALMNKGYSYSEKVIKKGNVTDQEYAKVAENAENLKGVSTKLDWEREYLYGETFKSILGNVSKSETGVPLEYKDYYLSKGYTLSDQVGISYLEYQYDDYLKGIKNKYEINKDGTYKLIEEGSRGNDIVLTIDIKLQQEVEKIIVNNLIRAKNEPNTEYYNKAFVIITEPKTGEILVMAGKQIVYDNGNYKVYDYTPGILTSPVVAGSVVKGASHIVGYNTKALTFNEIRTDDCIKIASTPEKCSWRYLGVLDDITALKYSSNTYQFRTAIKVGKGSYAYNQGLSLDLKAFDIYRKTFSEFGLGVKTEIDLPVESLGFKGKSEVVGHLLDFSIGQYDTYTPIQLSQYIGTIANDGVRVKPHLLKEVYKPTKEPLKELIYKKETQELNKVTTEKQYMDRVKLGFKTVLEPYGTGSGYIDLSYRPAGKTGTSQSFIDTNLDGKIDTETISNTFVAYAPYDNPKVTFTIISPDVSHRNNYSEYQSWANGRITQQVSQKYFEFYGG